MSRVIHTNRESNFELPVLLQKTMACLDLLGKEFDGYRREIRRLHERLATERFHLAVLGQFKRGKSTLLNALLGAELLPTSVVPLTAIPTFILWGRTMKARVLYLDAHPGEEFSNSSVGELAAFLSQYVTESNNPRNIKGVSHVEVFYPSPLLEQGVVLIDTPGIGSTYQHNTEVTLSFLSQCDAALFLVSADPPVTEVELEFLKAVRAKVTRLFFILNKIDYLSEGERKTLLDFIRNVLRERADVKDDNPIFCISARQGLEARKTGNEDLWKLSGLEEVRSHLIDFLARDKADALNEAVAKKTQDLIADVVMTIRLTIRSLQMPVAELGERLQVFEKKLKEAERERMIIGDLLVAERNRMAEHLEEQADSLRKAAHNHFEKVVHDSLDNKFDENEALEALKNAIPGFFEHELGNISHAFDSRLSDVLRSYQQKVNDLVETIRKTAADIFEIPYLALHTPGGLELGRRPSWVTHRWDANLRLLPENFIDRFLPVKLRRKRLIKRLSDQIRELVTYNVENLRWAMLQSLDEAFRRFRAGLEERLRETIAATRGAVQSARSKRLDQSEAVAPEVARLEKVADELKEIQEKLKELKRGISDAI